MRLLSHLFHKVHRNDRHHTLHRGQTLDMIDGYVGCLFDVPKHGLFYCYFDSC